MVEERPAHASSAASPRRAAAGSASPCPASVPSRWYEVAGRAGGVDEPVRGSGSTFDRHPTQRPRVASPRAARRAPQRVPIAGAESRTDPAAAESDHRAKSSRRARPACARPCPASESCSRRGSFQASRPSPTRRRHRRPTPAPAPCVGVKKLESLLGAVVPSQKVGADSPAVGAGVSMEQWSVRQLLVVEVGGGPAAGSGSSLTVSTRCEGLAAMSRTWGRGRRRSRSWTRAPNSGRSRDRGSQRAAAIAPGGWSGSRSGCASSSGGGRRGTASAGLS